MSDDFPLSAEAVVPPADLLGWAEDKLARELEPSPVNERLILSLPTANKILHDIRIARAALRQSQSALVPPARREEREYSTAELEMALRREWWLNHGCEFAQVYGDDGEMQCHGRDFKREPLQRLRADVEERRDQRIRAALGTPSSVPAINELRIRVDNTVDREDDYGKGLCAAYKACLDLLSVDESQIPPPVPASLPQQGDTNE